MLRVFWKFFVWFILFKMSWSDSCDEIEQVLSVEKPTKRKGVVNSDLYKWNVIKKVRLTGTEYVNYSGKTVAARTTGDQCKCKMKCFVKFKDYDFISILKGFSLQGPIERYDFNKRREFKKGLIQILTLKLRPIAHLKDKTLTSTL